MVNQMGEDVEHEADLVEAQKPRRKNRQGRNSAAWITGADFWNKYRGRSVCRRSAWIWCDNTGATFVSEGKKMPAMAHALSGQLLKQDVTTDVLSDAAAGKQQSDELRKGLLQCFIADLDIAVKDQ